MIYFPLIESAFMIIRSSQKKIEGCFFKGKAILIFGARQVGKCTLVKKPASHQPSQAVIRALSVRLSHRTIWKIFYQQTRFNRAERKINESNNDRGIVK